MPPIKHALLSASSADRWTKCPPSARLTEHLPSSTSPYAEEGTRAHELCERYLRTGLGLWFNGDNGIPAANDCPEEMVRAAQRYQDFIHELWLEFENQPSVFIEQEVRFTRWVREGFGTCDCLLIGDETLHIVDFKYGMGVPVSPEWNAQMMCYALGAYDMFCSTDVIERVRMSIVQPRIQSEPETFEIGADQLLDWAESTLAPAAKLAWEGKGELNPGEKQCRWCRAYPQCRAWQDKYGALADFEALPDARLLTPEEIGPWLKKVQGVAAYAKDLEAYALEQLVDGQAIPGWKAVEGRSTRQWSDQTAAFKAIEDSGIDPTMLFTREPITLTAAEKLLGKHHFTEVCGDYITRPAGSPKLATEDDKRPAINKLDGFGEVKD